MKEEKIRELLERYFPEADDLEIEGATEEIIEICEEEIDYHRD